MNKKISHFIVSLTFVMPVAALSGCSGSNDSPEQSPVIGVSSCARSGDGETAAVSEFGMFVTHTDGSIYTDNTKVTCQSGEWVFPDISLGDGEKGVYAYHPYDSSAKGGVMEMDARTQTDYLCSDKTMATTASPSVSLVLKHLLGKVNFQVSGQSLERISMADYNYSASYNVTTGMLSMGTERGSISSSSASLLLFPGEQSPKTITVTMNGKSYGFSMPSVTIQSGKEHTYTLTLTEEGMEITDIAIAQWQSGSDYEGIITEK